MSDSNISCAATCSLDRARFLRSTALAAIAGIAGAALFANPAFAQADSVAPLKTQNKLLTYAVPPKDGALIDAENGVILARLKNTVYALSIICPHRSVTKLEWLADSKEFHCPRHNAHFQPDGELIDGRPDRAMDRFAVRHTAQTIVVDTASAFEQDTAQNDWNRAFVSVA